MITKIFNRKKGFTLIELLAVIVILAIIATIATPIVLGIIESSKKSAFENDAKAILRSISYEKMENASFDPEQLTVENIKDLLGVNANNYAQIDVSIVNDVVEIVIVGKGNWNGLTAYGTSDNMRVVKSEDYDVSAPVITILGSNPVNINIGSQYVDAGATATDLTDGNVTSKIVTTGTVDYNTMGTYTITYTVKDNANNEAVSTRTVNVIDSAAPTVAFGTNGNSTYAKTWSTVVTVSDNIGVNTSSLKYQWTTSTTAPTEASFTTSFTNGATINTPASMTGGYYLWILSKDTTNNTAILRSNVFNIDNTNPTVAFGTNGNSTYAKTWSTVVTVSDNIGVNTSSLKYQWTTSTTAPTEASFTTSFTNGATINTPASMTGGYYLWILSKDTANNTAILRSNVFNIDNTNPTVDIGGTNATYSCSENIDVSITVSDNVGVNTSSLKYQWTTSTTTPTEASFTSSFTNNGIVSMQVQQGMSGTYYIWILASDTAGNKIIIRRNPGFTVECSVIEPPA